MKKIFVILCAFLFCAAAASAQRQCGIEGVKAALIAKDPHWAEKFESQRASLQGVADNYKQQHAPGTAERTTTISPIPVIFHIIITSDELTEIGGTAGILARINSQIDVLNEDYNKGNADGSLIPSGWLPLYASTGIHFGLAHTQPNGWGTSGCDLEIISTSGFNQGPFQSYSDAKHASSGGLDAWDNTKYLNVWCINFADAPGLLGVTVPLSFTTDGSGVPLSEMGVCMKYLALGRRVSASDNYQLTGWPFTGGPPDYYDKGRTLTHEIGHFFEIWHTWGDDGGQCPGSGGTDDGLADTPPEGNYKYYNYPDTIPGGTYYDQCKDSSGVNKQPYGVASLDFINYTDDVAMHLFTTDQAAAMASMALVPPASGVGATGSGTIGENYSLTQNPVLLDWPALTGVQQTATDKTLNISPNPTSGMVNITFDAGSDELHRISVINILGEEVENISTTGNSKDYYSIDLSAMSKGIYFVKCNFASGTITRKILLQ